MKFLRAVFVVLVLVALVPAFADAASGTLTVSQTSTAAGSLPKGAQRVTFLTLTFQAGCAANVAVSALNVVHSGLGNSDDLERVYVTAEHRRIARSTVIDASDQTATLRFRPELLIPACSTVTVHIDADLSATAETAGEHRLSVELPTDIQTDAQVTLSKSATSSVSTVRPQSTGTVSVQFLEVTQPLRFGTSRTLARFRLEADGISNQEIHAITFTNTGKATNEDVQNLVVRTKRGEALTDTQTSMDGDRVTLTFTPPYRLDRNHEILLELKGDIHASKRRTIHFLVEEPSDVEAVPRAR